MMKLHYVYDVTFTPHTHGEICLTKIAAKDFDEVIQIIKAQYKSRTVVAIVRKELVSIFVPEKRQCDCGLYVNGQHAPYCSMLDGV
jgi:phosphopantetheine adenylyltransferase